MSAHDAAVLSAHIAATIVGVVTSDLPSADVARAIGGEDGDPLGAMMASRVSWHEQLKAANAHLRLGHGVTPMGGQSEIVERGGRVALGCDASNAGDVSDILRAAAAAAGILFPPAIYNENSLSFMYGQSCVKTS